MARVPEMRDDAAWPRAYVIAGDYNAKEGEDDCITAEGWSDAASDRGWAWRTLHGASSARYDRVYIRGATTRVEVASFEILSEVWGDLSDHKALHIFLKHDGACPALGG